MKVFVSDRYFPAEDHYVSVASLKLSYPLFVAVRVLIKRTTVSDPISDVIFVPTGQRKASCEKMCESRCRVYIVDTLWKNT